LNVTVSKWHYTHARARSTTNYIQLAFCTVCIVFSGGKEQDIYWADVRNRTMVVHPTHYIIIHRSCFTALASCSGGPGFCCPDWFVPYFYGLSKEKMEWGSSLK